MELFCFTFAVLCYLAGREVIIIPPFMYKSIQFPKVSQRTFKTKGLISIEGTFFWDTLYNGDFPQGKSFFKISTRFPGVGRPKV